jgi:hypothetical protein
MVVKCEKLSRPWVRPLLCFISSPIDQHQTHVSMVSIARRIRRVGSCNVDWLLKPEHQWYHFKTLGSSRGVNRFCLTTISEDPCGDMGILLVSAEIFLM